MTAHGDWGKARTVAGLLVALSITVLPSGTASAAGLDDPVRTVAADHGLVVGAAASAAALQSDPVYATTLGAEYSSLTPENELKWDTTEPSQGVFDFSKGDALVSFAQAHGLKVRGHALVWNYQLPSWVTQLPCVRQTLMDVLRNHITTEVAHYVGRVQSWDVVNEAVDANGQLLHGIWLDCIGSDYIDLAFQWARQADPNVRLFYNDYAIESFSTPATQAHANGAYQLLSDLRTRGVPVDGVGLQAHIAAPGPTAAQLADALARYRGLGLKTAYSELDVRLPVLAGVASEADLIKQQQTYRRIAASCAGDASCEGVTTWGFTDKYSWVPSAYPGYGAALPFDQMYQPKPAYYGLREGLGEQSDIVDLYQAEAADKKDNGEGVSGAWRLRSNGSIVHHINVPRDGRYRFAVVAQSEQGATQGPAHIQLSLDGVAFGETDVSSPGWGAYAFEAQGTAGAHDLAISFTNDVSNAQGDRNVLIDRTTIAEAVPGNRLPLVSGGRAQGTEWSVADGGYAGSPFSVAETGAYAVVVRARTAGPLGVGMRISVDGVAMGSAAVTSTSPSDYRFDLALAGGHHHVTIAPTSSASGTLLIGSITVGTAGAPAPTS